MKTPVSITDLAADVSGFVKKAQTKGIVAISRRGRTVAFLVSREKLPALLESLELQRKPELMRLIKAHKTGKLNYYPIPDAI